MEAPIPTYHSKYLPKLFKYNKGVSLAWSTYLWKPGECHYQYEILRSTELGTVKNLRRLAWKISSTGSDIRSHLFMHDAAVSNGGRC